MNGAGSKNIIAYVFTGVVLFVLLSVCVLLLSSDEIIKRISVMLPLVGTYISMIVGIVLIGLAAYMYIKKPENGKDGWGIIAVGCVLIMVSFIKSAKISENGFEFELSEMSQYEQQVNRQVAEQKKQIDNQLKRINDLESDMALFSGDLERFNVEGDDFVSNKTLVKSLTNDKTNDNQLFERAKIDPIILLAAINEALDSVKPLSIESWKKLLNNASISNEIRPQFMELLPGIIRKLKDIRGTTEMVSELSNEFSAYIESNAPYQQDNAAHLKLMFMAAEEILGGKFPDNQSQYRLYYEYVRTNGVIQPNFQNVKPGDLLMVSPDNWQAPLRDGMPGFFGTMAPAIKWDPRKVLLKVIKTEETPVIGAPWVYVEIVYTSDTKQGPQKGHTGYIAWFNYRFIHAGVVN